MSDPQAELMAVSIEQALSPLLLLVARAGTPTTQLSGSQLQALLVLDERGPLRLTAFAGAMSVLPSSASRLCDRLAAADLVSRRSRPSDRREVLIELSSTGRRTVDALRQRRVEALTEALAQMDPRQHESLLHGLQALSQGFGLREDVAASG